MRIIVESVWSMCEKQEKNLAQNDASVELEQKILLFWVTSL